MSASTSPGNTSSSPEHTPRPATSLPPLSSGLDPVALIDARIQVRCCAGDTATCSMYIVHVYILPYMYNVMSMYMYMDMDMYLPSLCRVD